jgi:hypothetical protein
VALPEDIVTFVARNFAADDRAEVMTVLGSARLHDGRAADDRMLRCALVAAEKSLAKLKFQVEELACDFRDVILAGEYVKKQGEFVRTRDLSQPFVGNDA